MKPRPQNFGPWTTSLDAGSRLYLNTFWKQRLQRLAKLTSTRMPRRTLLAATLIAAVVGMSPLVELVPAAPPAAKTDDQAEAGTKAKAPAGDFVATFSNGVTVELIGLGQNPSAEGNWWSPDGLPLEKRPYHRVPALMGSAGNLAREVCWRWRGVEGEIKTGWGIEPAYNGAGGGQPNDEQNKEVEGLTAWAVSLTGSPETCTVKLSMTVPSTPWQTLDNSQAGPPTSTGRLLPNGKVLSLQYMRPRIDGDNTIVVIGYKASGDIRVVAIDKERKLHIGKIPNGGTSAGGFAMREVHFANVKPEDLKTWQFQTRQRKTEAVEFRNVSLHAGKVTDVETVFTTPVEPVRATAEADSPVEFGEVVERTVNASGNTDSLLDFETGKLLTPPQNVMGADAEDERQAWLKKNSVDTFASSRDPFKGLLGLSMIVLPAGLDDWESHSPQLLKELEYGTPGSPALMSATGTLPATYLFKTRENTRGVLQIFEIVDGKAVKLRYKLQKPE